MILGSHNSWSFLPPRKWWQKALAFTARCQRLNIQQQYEAGVRCFDLRLRRINGDWHVVHNSFDYANFDAPYFDPPFTGPDVWKDLLWLDFKADCLVRVVHDVRREKDYKEEDVREFMSVCHAIQRDFKHIKFWCGRNLYNWQVDYAFDFQPQCTEMYASVCSPHLIDDWFPLLYACRNNAWIRREDYKPDEVLLIDFVEIK